VVEAVVVEEEEALTNCERNVEEETRDEPGLGTASFDVEVEKPRPCLNFAAPSPLRVSSS